MRGWIEATLGLALGLGGGAAVWAQDWVVSPRQDGGAWAVQCLPSEGGGQIFTSLCLSVGCGADGSPHLVVNVQQVALPARTRVEIAVDGRGVADLTMTVPPGGVGGEVSLSGHEALIEALRSGSLARIDVSTAEGGRGYDVPLAGSRAAVDAALAGCPAAKAIPRDPVDARRSTDPTQDAIAVARTECDRLGGALTVGDGLATRRDLDGDGTGDLLLDYAGLLCDGVPPFCGSGGCSQEVWLARPSGGYLQILEDFAVRIEVPEPGRLHVVRDGAACGLSGADICEADYAIEGDALVPLP